MLVAWGDTRDSYRDSNRPEQALIRDRGGGFRIMPSSRLHDPSSTQFEKCWFGCSPRKTVNLGGKSLQPANRPLL